MALKILVNKTRKRIIVPLGKGLHPVVLLPQGDHSGGDMVPIDSDVAESSGVYQAVRTGKVAVQDVDGDGFTALEQRDQALEQRRAEAKAETTDVVESVMERRQDRDLVGALCIAPSAANPNLPCDAEVIRPNVKNGDEPPLCTRHQSMSGQYVATEVEPEGDGFIDGPSRTKWTRTSGMDNRSKAL